ncbi:MAG: ATP-binding protein [Anaerolineae bacterium]|nr:ATP-binding protein [Anaerolineae bacterium]
MPGDPWWLGSYLPPRLARTGVWLASVSRGETVGVNIHALHQLSLKTVWTRVFCGPFVLIGSMNPCPCGYYGDPVQECTCSNAMVTRYQKRISGPLLDRIDIHIEVPRVDYEKLSSDRLGEPSAAIHAQVEAARDRQRARFRGTRLLANADMGPGEVRDFCRLDDAGKRLLKAAMHQLNMSARAYHRILKLARTIADLAGSAEIQTAHLAEAIQYRPRRQT